MKLKVVMLSKKFIMCLKFDLMKVRDKQKVFVIEGPPADVDLAHFYCVTTIT